MTTNETLSATTAPAPAREMQRRRVTWIVASRGDVLTLGPAFQALKARRTPGHNHWLLDSGEAGMAAIQARDLLGLTPDETDTLCHPADEPAVRLGVVLARAEAFVRRHKGTDVIFTGCGPSAAAAAIYSHARGCRALWLRPPDPAGLLLRLRWEAGLERMIRACAPCVEVWQIPAAPDFAALPGVAAWPAAETLEEAIPGLRPGAPRVLIAVLRRDWGYIDDATSRLARAAAAWAARHPEADFVIISNLNARLEGPVRSLHQRPGNLLLAPPLPYPVYLAALRGARVALTDSPLLAAEALGRGVPVATLGDLPPTTETHAGARGESIALQPADLDAEPWLDTLAQLLATPPAPAGEVRSDAYAQIEAKIADWLA